MADQHNLGGGNEAQGESHFPISPPVGPPDLAESAIDVASPRPQRGIGLTTLAAGLVALLAVVALVIVVVVRNDDSGEPAAPTTTATPLKAGPTPRVSLRSGSPASVKIGSQGIALATFPAIFGRPVVVDVSKGTASIDRYQDGVGEHDVSTAHVVIPPASGTISLVVRGKPGATVDVAATEVVPSRLTLGAAMTGVVGPKAPVAVFAFSLEAPARLHLDFGGTGGRTTESRAVVVDAAGYGVADLQGHALSGTGDHFLIVEWLGRKGALATGTPPTKATKYELTLEDLVNTLGFDGGTSAKGSVTTSDQHATLHVPPNSGATVTLTPDAALRAGIAVTCVSPTATVDPATADPAAAPTTTTGVVPPAVSVPDAPGQPATATVVATPSAQTCDVLVSAGTSGTEGAYSMTVASG